MDLKAEMGKGFLEKGLLPSLLPKQSGASLGGMACELKSISTSPKIYYT